MGFRSGFGEKSKKRFGRIVAPRADQAEAEVSADPTVQPVSPRPAEKPKMVFKDVWCVCTVNFEAGHKRPGILLGISPTGVHVRFRSKTQLPQKSRIKAARLGLDAPVHFAWQDEFDAILTFKPPA